MKQDLVFQMAAKAVIVNPANGKILILREAASYADGTNTGKYHMPGGRLEPGETYWQGLEREVMEETGLKVEPEYPLHIDEWRPVIKGVPHHIIAVFTLCTLKGKASVTTSSEHDEAVWIDPQKAADYALLPGEAKAAEAYLTRALNK
jgi:8-oxo-dGTP diphosphatase